MVFSNCLLLFAGRMSWGFPCRIPWLGMPALVAGFMAGWCSCSAIYFTWTCFLAFAVGVGCMWGWSWTGLSFAFSSLSHYYFWLSLCFGPMLWIIIIGSARRCMVAGMVFPLLANSLCGNFLAWASGVTWVCYFVGPLCGLQLSRGFPCTLQVVVCSSQNLVPLWAGLTGVLLVFTSWFGHMGADMWTPFEHFDKLDDNLMLYLANGSRTIWCNGWNSQFCDPFLELQKYLFCISIYLASDREDKCN